MHHSPLFIVTCIVLDLWFIATMCRVLTMRSPIAYGSMTLVTMCCLLVSLELHMPVATRATLFGIPHAIVLPLVCSSDPLARRLTRTVLVSLLILAAEFCGTSLLALLSQGSIDSIDVTDTYVICTPLIIPSYEAFVALCRMSDHRGQPLHLKAGIVAACLVAYVPFCAFALALYVSNLQNLGIAAAGLLCTLLSFALCLATLWAANHEARFARDEELRAARLRQGRRMSAEVDSAIRQTVQMRRLRHDLANQIDVVEWLADQGREAEAKRYLDDLQGMVRDILQESGDHHG